MSPTILLHEFTKIVPKETSLEIAAIPAARRMVTPPLKTEIATIPVEKSIKDQHKKSVRNAVKTITMAVRNLHQHRSHKQETEDYIQCAVTSETGKNRVRLEFLDTLETGDFGLSIHRDKKQNFLKAGFTGQEFVETSEVSVDLKNILGLNQGQEFLLIEVIAKAMAKELGIDQETLISEAWRTKSTPVKSPQQTGIILPLPKASQESLSPAQENHAHVIEISFP